MAVIRWALATIQVINGDDATRRVFRDLRRDPSHKRVARRSPDGLHEVLSRRRGAAGASAVAGGAGRGFGRCVRRRRGFSGRHPPAYGCSGDQDRAWTPGRRTSLLRQPEDDKHQNDDDQHADDEPDKSPVHGYLPSASANGVQRHLLVAGLLGSEAGHTASYRYP